MYIGSHYIIIAMWDCPDVKSFWCRVAHVPFNIVGTHDNNEKLLVLPSHELQITQLTLSLLDKISPELTIARINGANTIDALSEALEKVKIIHTTETARSVAIYCTYHHQGMLCNLPLVCGVYDVGVEKVKRQGRGDFRDWKGKEELFLGSQ